MSKEPLLKKEMDAKSKKVLDELKADNANMASLENALWEAGMTDAYDKLQKS